MLCLVARKMLWINIVVVLLQRRFYQISLGGSVQVLQGSVLKIPWGIRAKNCGIQVTFLAEIVTVKTKLNTKLAIPQSVDLFGANILGNKNSLPQARATFSF